MALTDLTRISTSGIATGSTIDSPILRKDVDFRGDQVGVGSALFDSSEKELNLKDNVKLTFGDKTNGDLQVYHDGGQSYIKDNGTGQLYIQGSAAIHLENSSGNKKYFRGVNGAASELFFDGNKKIETTDDGALVTGILTATSFSGGITGNIVGNVYAASGISTFYDLRVTNNLTVEGTTTTLDTNLIGVDRVEVGANSNSIVGVAITQSGTADIVNLFDGGTNVLTVTDTGDVGIGSAIPGVLLDVQGHGGGGAQYTIRSKSTAANASNFVRSESNDGLYIGLLKYGTGHSAYGALPAGGGAVYANSSVPITIMSDGGSGYINFATGGNTEKVRITSDGKVGIGTVDPQTSLHVYDGASGFRLERETSNPGYFNISISHGTPTGATNYGSAYFSLSQSTGDYVWRSSTAERMRLKGNGKLGIGTDNPDEKLHVVTTSSSAIPLVLERTHNNNVVIKFENTTGNMYAGISGNALGWGVGTGANLGSSSNNKFIVRRDTGYVGINNLSPDQRLKISGNIEVNAYDNSNGQNGYYTSKGLIIGNAYDAAKLVGVNSVTDDRNAIIWNERGLDIDFATSDTWRMKLTYDGKLGIGITNVDSNFKTHIKSSTFGLLKLETTLTGSDGPYLELYHNSTSPADNDELGIIQFKGKNDASQDHTYAYMMSQSIDVSDGSEDGEIFFATAGGGVTLERLRITSSGHLKHTGLRAGNSENKLARLTTPSYNTSEEDVVLYTAENESGSNQISFGGGTSSYNAATQIRFLTASAVNTTTGSERLRIDSDGKLLLGTEFVNGSNAGADISLFISGVRSNYGGQATNAVIFDNQTAAVDKGGSLTFAGYSGSSAIAKALIRGGNEGSSSTQNGYFAVFTRPTSGSLTEKLRITSGGIVRIGGETANSADIDESNTKLTIKQSSNQAEDGIYIERSGERRGHYIYVGGGLSQNDALCIRSQQLGTDTDVLAIDRGGDVVIGAGNIKMNTSGKGINFYNYGSGTDIDSNLLADYEEGTFDPTLYYGSGTSEPTYSWRYGHYIKVGKQVTVWFNIGITNFTTTYSQAWIGGLPFQSNDPAAQWKYLNHMMGYSHPSGWGDGSNDKQIFLAIYDNQTKMMLNHNGNHLSYNGSDDRDIGTGQRFSCTVTYQTD